MTNNVIDLTTRNNVYNPTTAQGQWFQHRWGQRIYPTLDADLCWIKQHLSPDIKYDLHSVYGDPMCWKDLLEFADWCAEKPEVFTYGNIDDHSVIESLRQMRCYTVIKIDGIDDLCGKVHLGAQWESVKKSIESVAGYGAVELHTYEHNIHQIPALIDLCDGLNINLFLTMDTQNDEFGTSIITKDCKWLYDVKPHNTGVHAVNIENSAMLKNKYKNHQPMSLNKHLWAYKSLRTYMPPQRYRNIYQSPLLSKMIASIEIQENFNRLYNAKDGIFVSPDCEIFHNHHTYTMYMYLLGNDWKLDNSYLNKNRDNVFVSEVLLYAQHIIKDIIQQKQ